MSFFVLLALGLALGGFASWFYERGRYGPLADPAIGVLGAFIGSFVAGRLFPIDAANGNGPANVVTTLLGAGLLMVLARVLKARVLAPLRESWRRATVAPLPAALRLRLTAERGLSARDVAALRMLQERGRYAGRAVHDFLVFDPLRVSLAGAALRHLADLDPRRVLHAGHIERDGQIVLHRRASELPA